MSKRLPYYQFEPAEYLTKNVSFCTLAAQGLFINICSYYWQRDCQLKIEQIKRRFSENEKEYKELLEEEIIKEKDGFIVVYFLDKQFQEASRKSLTNSKNGKKGGRPKKQTETQNKATENPKESEIKGNKIKEDNKKENKKTEYKKLLLSELKNSDVDENILLITKSFQKLFIENLKSAGASTSKVEKAKGTWIDPIRLMIEKDKYKNEQFQAVYLYLQKDDFWKSNILSTSKLRQQFEKLLLNIKKEKNGGTNKQSNQGASKNELITILNDEFDKED